jgi:hypothetical protein
MQDLYISIIYLPGVFVVKAQRVHYLVQSSENMKIVESKTTFGNVFVVKPTILWINLPSGRTETGTGGGTRLLQGNLWKNSNIIYDSFLCK